MGRLPKIIYDEAEVKKVMEERGLDETKAKRYIYRRDWYQENKERCNTRSKKWAKENKERLKQLNKIYYQENKEKIKEINKRSWKKYYKNHPEKCRSRWNQYYATHRKVGIYKRTLDALKELASLATKYDLQIEFDKTFSDVDGFLIKKYKEHPVTKKLYVKEYIMTFKELEGKIFTLEEQLCDLSKFMDDEIEEMFKKDEDLSKCINKIERMDFD